MKIMTTKKFNALVKEAVCEAEARTWEQQRLRDLQMAVEKLSARVEALEGRANDARCSFNVTPADLMHVLFNREEKDDD